MLRPRYDPGIAGPDEVTNSILGQSDEVTFKGNSDASIARKQEDWHRSRNGNYVEDDNLFADNARRRISIAKQYLGNSDASIARKHKG